jgi:hypothetical protein
MMRLLLLAILPVLGTLIMRGQALACPVPPPEEQVLASAGLVFTGEVDRVDGEFVRFVVREYFKGDGPSDLRVRWVGADVRAVDLPGLWNGDEHIVVVHLDDEGNYTTSDCTNGTPRTSASVEALTGPGHPPQTTQGEAGENDKDTPWAVVLPLAFAIPLATLLVPAFLARRRGGH